MDLQHTAINNGWFLSILWLTTATTRGFDGLDDIHAIFNFTKDDMLAIEPAGNNSRDEELGTVAITRRVSRITDVRQIINSLRVWASVGHGEKAGPVMFTLEVLVGELLTVNRLATRTLIPLSMASLDRKRIRLLTLPRVKSPPCSMKSGMIRWKEEPLYPNPF